MLIYSTHLAVLRSPFSGRSGIFVLSVSLSLRPQLYLPSPEGRDFSHGMHTRHILRLVFFPPQAKVSKTPSILTHILNTLFACSVRQRGGAHHTVSLSTHLLILKLGHQRERKGEFLSIHPLETRTKHFKNPDSLHAETPENEYSPPPSPHNQQIFRSIIEPRI